MRNHLYAGLGLALLAGTAVPVAASAQAAPTQATALAQASAPNASPSDHKFDGRHRRGGGRMTAFKDLSPEGRATLRDAMRKQASPEERQAMRAAREQVLTRLSAEPLNVSAVRQAQAQERSLAQKNHMERQEALLAAYQKLTPEDRKAFVSAMRELDNRMENRMRGMRDQRGAGQRPPADTNG